MINPNAFQVKTVRTNGLRRRIEDAKRLRELRKEQETPLSKFDIAAIRERLTRKI